jgi:hypothetical protein
MNMNIEKVQVTKKVGEALDVLISELGREKLFSRGFEFLKYCSARKARGMNRPHYDAAVTVKRFVMDEDLHGQASLYMRMLLVGVDVELSKEEKALDLIADALAILHKQQEVMENFTANGPMSVRERGLPRSYYERAAAIDILEAIEL